MHLETSGQFTNESHNYPFKTMERFRDKANLPISLEDLEKLCEGDKLLESLFNSMLVYCRRYAEDVGEMDKLAMAPRLSRDENWKSEMEARDKARTVLHNATIDSINILSRNLKERGKSNTWLIPIATVTDPDERRATYAKFAIALAFSYYLSLRKKVTHGQDN